MNVGRATQVLLTGQALSRQQVLGVVDKVTLEDVVRVAKKVIPGKPSMAAIEASHTHTHTTWMKFDSKNFLQVSGFAKACMALL